MLIMIIIAPTINALDLNSQINPDNYETYTTEDSETFKFGGRVAGIIQIVGTIVSIGALIVIGIRYAVSSVEDKAEYKERMLPYIIGCVLLFGSTNIVNILYKFSEFDTETTGLEVSIDISKYKYDNNYFFCPNCKIKCKKTVKDNNHIKCTECSKTYVCDKYKENQDKYSNCNLCPVCGYWYEILDENLTCYHCNWNYTLTIQTMNDLYGIETCKNCNYLTRTDIRHPVGAISFCIHCHKGTNEGLTNYEYIYQRYGVYPIYEECFEDESIVKERYEKLLESRIDESGIPSLKCNNCGEQLFLSASNSYVNCYLRCYKCQGIINYKYTIFNCFDCKRTDIAEIDSNTGIRGCYYCENDENTPPDYDRERVRVEIYEMDGSKYQEGENWEYIIPKELDYIPD